MRHDARSVWNGQHVLGDAGSQGNGRRKVHTDKSAVQTPVQTQQEKHVERKGEQSACRSDPALKIG